ncbi:hypothetical protein [Cellvibrio sp. pealriver]|uniref:hypothetical protein n=1 Tax=Cellvibrio sp. pealriver TaxID=1622269 RepID=UPI00066FF2AF|nr:hypothetical protein [Cellvibrio sp. pealriver]
MNKCYLLIAIIGSLGCSPYETVHYGKLPCANTLTEYKSSIYNIKEKLDDLNGDDIKEFIYNENGKLHNFDKEIFNCVLLIHQKNRDAYSNDDRDTIILFSDSYGRIKSANDVFLKNENINETSLNLLNYMYITETTILDKTSE